MQTFTFYIHNSGDRSVGIQPFSDCVTMQVKNGVPQDKAWNEAFIESMRETLKALFDDATECVVLTEAEEMQRLEAERRHDEYMESIECEREAFNDRS